MPLWKRLHRIIFGYEPPVYTLPKKPSMSKPSKEPHKVTPQMAVYECPLKEGPAALVRYTTYHEDGKPLAVEQVSYSIEAEGLMELDFEVYAALELGVDVLIFTRIDIAQLPKLGMLTTRG